MNSALEQRLIFKIQTLWPHQVTQVEDAVEFLSAKARKRAAIDRLLSLLSALKARH